MSRREALMTAMEDVTNMDLPPGVKKPTAQPASLRTGPPRETIEQLKKVQEIVEKKEVFPDDYNNKGQPTGRRLFAMRHAERLDRILPEWLRHSFASGSYVPYDLNMPVSLPARKNILHFHNDPPITEIGFMTAQMVGRAFAVNKHRISHVYASPSLRAVQSAHAFLRAYQKAPNVKIRIEPGFFEWMGFYENELPEWMTVDELTAMDLPVDPHYKPIFPVEMIQGRRNEFGLDFGNRLTNVVDRILKQDAKDANGVVIIGHATTVDGVTRKLRGRIVEAQEKEDMEKMGLWYPYCCVAGIEECQGTPWRSLKNPVPHISYVNCTSAIDFTKYNR